jgi:hypothetical protein
MRGASEFVPAGTKVIGILAMFYLFDIYVNNMRDWRGSNFIINHELTTGYAPVYRKRVFNIFHETLRFYYFS